MLKYLCLMLNEKVLNKSNQNICHNISHLLILNSKKDFPQMIYWNFKIAVQYSYWCTSQWSKCWRMLMSGACCQWRLDSTAQREDWGCVVQQTGSQVQNYCKSLPSYWPLLMGIFINDVMTREGSSLFLYLCLFLFIAFSLQKWFFTLKEVVSVISCKISYSICIISFDEILMFY